MGGSAIATAQILGARIAINGNVARFDPSHGISNAVTNDEEAIFGRLIDRRHWRFTGRVADAAYAVDACGLFAEIKSARAIRRLETTHALPCCIAIGIQTASRSRDDCGVQFAAIQARVDRTPIVVVWAIGIIVDGFRSAGSVAYDNFAVFWLLKRGTRG